MRYVSDNEHPSKLKIVTVLPEGESIDQEIKRDVKVLGRAYPGIKIELIVLDGEFGPELIDRLSREWKIPKNLMFLGSPGDKFPYRIDHLGGVRLII